MNRCSFCEWIPILPWPVCPLAGHARLGQNTVVGSMTILLSWLCWGACQEEVCLDPRCPVQPHSTTVSCGATILLADQYPIVREGLKTILGTPGDFRVLGETGDGLEAMQLVASLYPDLL